MTFRHISTFMIGLVALFGCQPNLVPESNGSVHEIDPAGGTCQLELTTENRWSVVNDNAWIHATPGAGLAGNATITVNVPENDSMEERSGAIYVIDGAKTHMFSFHQNCLDIISTDNKEYFVPESGYFVVLVRSTVGYSIATDAPWIELPASTHFEASSNETEIRLGLESNSSSSERRASLVFTTDDGKSLSVSVIQSAHIDVDWSKNFFKRELLYRFTGDWCGYCPNLEYDINCFNRDYPDKLSVICFYDGNSSTTLQFRGCSKYETRFYASDKPTMVIDERGFASGVASPEYYNIIKSVVAEDDECFPAKTAIVLQTSLEDGKISVHPTVYFKEGGQYHIHIALLESGIVARQADYTGIYTESQLAKFVHDNVVRTYVTEMLNGDSFTADAKSAKVFNYSLELPGNVLDKRNLSVAVYITRQAEEGNRNVAKFYYYKDRNEIVDNSVIVPLGQSSTLKYE